LNGWQVSQGISVYVSTLTMTIIALDRFVVVCYPYRQRMQIKTSLLFVAVTDLLAVLFVLPYGFHIKIIVGFDGEDRCNEVSISPTFNKQLFCVKVFCSAFICLEFGFVSFL
jgi:hypothetical protein